MKGQKRAIRPAQRKKILIGNLQAYSFLLPNLILFTACSLYPVIWTLKYVFFQYGGYGTGEPLFVGWENLARVFRDRVYWESVLHTFTYGFGKLILILPIAFFLALLLNQQKKGNG